MFLLQQSGGANGDNEAFRAAGTAATTSTAPATTPPPPRKRRSAAAKANLITMAQECLSEIKRGDDNRHGCQLALIAYGQMQLNIKGK